MKSFVILSVLIAVVAAIPPPEVQKNIDACIAENAVNEQEFKDLMAGKLNPASVGDNLKCTVKCIMVKGGVMDAAGKFDAEAFKTKFTEVGVEKKKWDEAIDKCKSMAGPTPCEAAYKIIRCMMENNVKMID